MKLRTLKKCVAKAALIALSVTPSYGALVAHWNLDESSGTTAANSITTSETAVNTGGGLSWVPGQIGNAVQLDGASTAGHDLRISTISALNNATQMTLSLWFNPESSQIGFVNYKGLLVTRKVTDNSGANKNWGIAWESKNHIDSRIGNKALDSGTDLSGTAAWYHVAMVWDGDSGTRQLYVNGVANPSSGGTSPISQIISNGEWFIGKDPHNNNRHFKGSIDDVAIWDEALTANQIEIIYDSGLLGTDASSALCSGLSATISADTSVCETVSNYTASVTDAGGAAVYNWTIDNGSITAGQGTETITYTAGSPGTTTLNCTVELPLLGCTESSGDIFVTVNALPTPLSVSGPTSVSPNQTGVIYSVPSSAGSSFEWTVPEGSTITNGKTGPNNNQITVDFGQYSGEVSALEANASGCEGDVEFLAVSTGIAPPHYYVSNSGNDTNPGTRSQPFQSIQQAANIAQPGDTIFVRGGTYRETIIVPTSGTLSNPITFTNYRDEEVILSGGDPVTGWTLHDGDIWKATNTWNIGPDGQGNTLFHNGILKFEAAFGAEGDPLRFSNWGKISKPNMKSTYFTANSLRGFGDDYWNGAKVRTHQNDWRIKTSTIADYESSTGKITFAASIGGISQKHELGYSIYDTIKALDKAGEWYKDRSTDTLYYQTAPGKNPNDQLIEFKAREHAFDLSAIDNVTLDGFTFRGTGIKTDIDSDNNVISNNNLYGYDRANYGRFFILGENNTLTGNEFSQTWSSIVTIRGKRNQLVNNYIHDIGYDGTARVLVMGGQEHFVAYNTVRKFARSFLDGFPLSSEFAYNLFEDGANLSWDTGVFDGDAARGNGGGSIVHHNVFRNSSSIGIYMAFYSGMELVVHHNLIYDTSPFTIRTGFHTFAKYYHNTSIGTAPLAGVLAGRGIETSYNNNLQVHLDSLAVNDIEMLGNFNYTAEDFVNFSGKDFRLKAGSGAIDRGIVLPGINDGYTGAAPDAGALEFGENLWKVGHDFDTPPVASYSWSALPGTNLFNNSQFRFALSDEWNFTGTPTRAHRNAWNTTGKGLARLGNESIEFKPGDGMSRVFENLKPNTKYVVGVEVKLANQVIEAEQYSSIQGDIDTGLYRTENYITGLIEGEWISYDNIDFGAPEQYNTMQFTYSRAGNSAQPTSPLSVEARLGSPTGTLLGSFVINPVAKESWYSATIDIPATTGNQNVFLLPVGPEAAILRIANLRLYHSNIIPDNQLTIGIRNHGDYPLTTRVGNGTWSLELETFSFTTGASATSAELFLANNGPYNAYLDRMALFEGGLDTVNVAPIGYTLQSTTLGSNLSKRAVDGRISRRAITKNRSNSWWQVDLGEPYDINSFKLTAPTHKPARMSNFRVSLWTNDPRDGNMPLWQNDYLNGTDLDPGESLIIKPTDRSVDGVTDLQMFSGRYIRVQVLDRNNEGKGNLGIAELEALDYDELNLTQTFGETYVGPENWFVQFPQKVNLGKIELLNTDDANHTELSNFQVRVWDAAETSGGSVIWEKAYLPNTNVGSAERFYIPGDEIGDDGYTRLNSVTGRVVEVRNNGLNVAGNNNLALEDIVIYDGLDVPAITNIALIGQATQSSNYYPEDGHAGVANNSFILPKRDFTSTKNESNAWWQLELAQSTTIDQIVVFNRIDVASRIGNFRVSVWSEDPNGSGTELWGKNYSYSNGDIPAGGSLTIKGSDEANAVRLDDVAGAKYVRVQLAGKNLLSLAEVQVWAPNSSIRTDSSTTSFDFDLGTPDSPVLAGSTRVSHQSNGDVSWTGFVESTDRGPNASTDDSTRDFVTGKTPASLNIKVSNGIWDVTVELGDSTEARDNMMVWAEGEIVTTDTDTATGETKTISYQVIVTDGELNLQFDQNGGNGNGWAATKVSLNLAP